MKRILIIGCPGSGKSTFARKLHALTNIPLYYLDMLYHNADKTTVTCDVFDSRLEEILQKDTWIIDGNYSRTMERRLCFCDTVFFFDLPSEVCLDGVLQRRGKPREDMPWIETEEDKEFTDYIKDFSSQKKPQITEILSKYGGVRIITFRSREEADSYFQNDL